MRCPDCQKFVSFEEQDPDVESVDLNDGTVTADVRIVNACAECSTELTEASFSMETTVALAADTDKTVPEEITDLLAAHKCEKKDKDDEPSFSTEDESSERTQRQGYFKGGKFVPKYGRYGKSFYGASIEVSIKCEHCDEVVAHATLNDEVQASGMDSLV